jgi:hypothetical protein
VLFLFYLNSFKFLSYISSFSTSKYTSKP